MALSRYDQIRSKLPRPIGAQSDVVALSPRGHYVVLGTAGSGKTTMAMLRALFLADPRTEHAGRTLLVTYNRALLAFLRQVIRDDNDLLEIRNYHHFALGYLASRGRPTDGAVSQGETRQSLIRRAIAEVRSTEQDVILARHPSFFDAELSWMSRHGATDLATYRDADRIGRLQPLAPTSRPAVIQVRLAYERLRAEADLHYDWDDLATEVIREFASDDRPRRYRHIVIDEGQDFSVEMLRSLVAAVGPAGSVTVFGDIAQQIYGRGISWRSAGLRVSKVWEFAKNYRNSPQIAALGQAIAEMPYFREQDDMVLPDEFSDEGPPPTLARFASDSAEKSWTVAQAEALGRVGTTGVLFRRSVDAERFIARCGKAQLLSRYTPIWSSDPGVWASTVHAAKGFEFQSVILSGVTADRWPEPELLRTHGDDEARAVDGRLLYVAVTRARQNLLMTAVGPVSDLLPANDNLWIERAP